MGESTLLALRGQRESYQPKPLITGSIRSDSLHGIIGGVKHRL